MKEKKWRIIMKLVGHCPALTNQSEGNALAPFCIAVQKSSGFFSQKPVVKWLHLSFKSQYLRSWVYWYIWRCCLSSNEDIIVNSSKWRTLLSRSVLIRTLHPSKGPLTSLCCNMILLVANLPKSRSLRHWMSLSTTGEIISLGTRVLRHARCVGASPSACF